jgi:general secretion pathway protein F
VAPQTFKYTAVDSSGATRSGEISSPSQALAVEALSRRGLIPLSVDLGAAGSTGVRRSLPDWLRVRRRGQATTRELLDLTQSTAALLKAGLTVDRALQIGVSLAPNRSTRDLADALLTAVRAGKTISVAFAESRQKLPSYFVTMVNAGESGGSLAETLGRLAELMRKQQAVRERIRSALLYPTLLAGVVLFTLVMLLVFVLPRFELLFAESEAPLPWSTRAVLSLARMLADYWWAFVLVCAAGVCSFVTWAQTSYGRIHLDKWLLRTRLTMGLPGAVNTARFLRTLGTLCSNGMPLTAAVRISQGTLANRYLVEAMRGISREIQAGRAFSSSFARAGCFPPVAVQLARVGEETGHLDAMLLSAADVLEDESQRTLERLLSLVVPLLTIGMGMIVAGLISSVLIGLLSVNDIAY